MSNDRILSRISRELNDENIVKQLADLPMADLNTLFLELYRQKSNAFEVNNFLRSYTVNRFTSPSNIDALNYHRVEIDMLEVAQKLDIKNILLSPVAPFGTSSVFGCVNQNNILTAVRGTEVLSDPTNMLAVIIADKIKNNEITNDEPYHLCTTARVVRAQKFERPDFYSHFGIFCIVSSGIDKGSYCCEKQLLKKHFDYYIGLLEKSYHKQISIELSRRAGYVDSDGFFSRVKDYVQSIVPGVPVLETEQVQNNYYIGINFKIYVCDNNDKIEVCGGGFVDWINKLTNNKKGRCLTSGVSIEHLMDTYNAPIGE